MILDPDSLVDQVRVLVGDTDDTDLIFSDDEIYVLLGLRSGSVYGAAADACRAIAANSAMTLQYIKTHDMTLDGAVVAKQLLALSQDFESRYSSSESTWLIVRYPDDCA